jgi:alkanesulfonate monooxygenase SsuD/methylene tetrahydromethanopterin reductase-like flavin-dependent oxidoreductase (luciferase family)
VDVQQRTLDAQVIAGLYHSVIDRLTEASRLGYDAIGVNEHHNTSYALTPSPNLLAAPVINATRGSDTAVCVLGNSLVKYNPPVRVAEEFAMLDCLSEGRLIAGFPVGTPMDTAYAYSGNPSEIRERYLEANDLIRKAWTSSDSFAYNGRFHKLRYVNIAPQTYQKPHPPVWVPGAGAVETWDFCCEHDSVYCYLTSSGYYKGEAIVEGFQQRVKEHGLEPNPFRAGYALFLAVADSLKEARELYGEAASYFWNRTLNINPKFAGPPGYLSEASMRKVFASGGGKAGANWDMSGPGFDDFVAKSYLVAGDPDSVSEQIAEIGRKSNIGNFISVTAYGNMPHDLAMHNTRMFARTVMPNVRDIFENEWEHHWWPKGLPRPTVPTEPTDLPSTARVPATEQVGAAVSTR